MSRRFSTLIALAAASILALVAGVADAKKLPETWDGLVLTPKKGLDAVYLRPNVEFKAYKSVTVDPVEVAFDKNWDPNRSQRDLSRRISSSDMQEIKQNMATEFRKVLTEELTAGGYPVVDMPGEDTLRVICGLANVYITAPDTMSAGRSTTYTFDSGHMTLVMELRDGPTGQLLARVLDTKAGSNSSFMQVTNSVTNSADFRRAVRDWAQRLVKGLDKVNGKAQ